MKLRSAGGDLEATFAPERGMACVSLRHRGDELVCGEPTVSDPVLRRAMVGIPLLHPWANRLSRDEYTQCGRTGRLAGATAIVPRLDDGTPIHGLLPAPDAWQAQREGADALCATLYHRADGSVRFAAFPFSHRLDMAARVDDGTLTVELELTATDEVPVPIAFGAHPYFRLPTTPRRQWQVQLPGRERVEVDARGFPTGVQVPQSPSTRRLEERSLDEAFAKVAPGASFTVSDGSHYVCLRFDHGFGYAQVYAPPAADLVCFEPMTAPIDALVRGCHVVPPGARYTARFRVSVGTGEPPKEP